MKKLSKLKLQNANFMHDYEMKIIVGGCTSGNTDNKCSYAGETIVCYGTCEEKNNCMECFESGRVTGKICKWNK